MGFLDFFRKKKEVKQVEVESVPFGELNSWIENKIESITADKGDFMNSIGSRVNQLRTELETGITGLKGVDLEKKNTEDRIKKIVRDSLDTYIGHLGQLKEDLGNLEEWERSNIDKLITGFDKRAGKSYQKSTFLVSDELSVINRSVRGLFEDLDKLQDENKDMLQKYDIVKGVKKEMIKISKNKKIIGDVEIENNKIDENNEKLLTIIKGNENRIEDIKNDDKYLEWIGRNKQYGEIIEKREKMINSLRGEIDFKELAKIWHENKIEMSVISGYKEKFDKAYGKDKGEVLSRIVNSQGNKEKIQEMILEINVLGEKIEETNLEESLTIGVEDEIKKGQNEITSLNLEKEKNTKRIEKIELENEMTKNVMKKSLLGVGVELQNYGEKFES